MRPASLLFLIPAVLSAQPFTIGVKGGVRLTGDLDSPSADSESQRYVVGPMVTAKLPLGFRFEFDALYRHVAFRTSFGNFFSSSTERDHGNSWEFPLIVRHGVWRGVYAGVGYAPRVINGSGHVNQVVTLPVSFYSVDQPGDWNTTHGVIGAAGIEKRVGPLRFAPEVRYTFWSTSALDKFGPQGYFVRSAQHQVDLLIGISFP